MPVHDLVTSPATFNPQPVPSRHLETSRRSEPSTLNYTTHTSHPFCCIKVWKATSCQVMHPSLFVCRQRLHGVRVHRHLHFIAIRRCHQQHPHARERIHERQIAESQDAKHSSANADFPEAEGDVGQDAVDGWVDLEVAS